MTSIAIMNAKGGVGKSTLTMAIAETLAEHHGRSALVIDADGQMSISLMMARGSILSERREANRTLVGLFVSEVLDEIQTDWPHYVLRDISDVDDLKGLYLIPGDMDLPLLEREVAVANRFAALRTSARTLLTAAKQYVDVVLVDCAPGISVMTETWLRECDHHLVPVKPDFLAVTGLEYVRRFRSRNPEMGFANHLGLVINMLEPMSGSDRVIMEHLRADTELNCFHTPIPFSNQMQRAALFSPEPPSYIAKYAGDAGRAVRAVTDELVARLEHHAATAVEPSSAA